MLDGFDIGDRAFDRFEGLKRRLATGRETPEGRRQACVAAHQLDPPLEPLVRFPVAPERGRLVQSLHVEK